MLPRQRGVSAPLWLTHPQACHQAGSCGPRQRLSKCRRAARIHPTWIPSVDTLIQLSRNPARSWLISSAIKAGFCRPSNDQKHDKYITLHCTLVLKSTSIYSFRMTSQTLHTPGESRIGWGIESQSYKKDVTQPRVGFEFTPGKLYCTDPFKINDSISRSQLSKDKYILAKEYGFWP